VSGAKHLVTGGTGFLGRHLVARLLESGQEVVVLAREGSEVAGLEPATIVSGDVTKRDDLARALEGCSRVFNLAAEMRDGQPAALYDAVNHQAVETLLDLALERGVERIVHTSHYYAIGRSGEPRSAPDFVNDEYWTHDPGDMHDACEESKYDAENSVNQRVSGGKPVMALIPTMMYGPERRPVAGPDDLRPANRIVGMFASHAAGRYPGIPGDGRQLWNLVHVEDVAAAHVKVMEAEAEGGRWPPARWGHWHYVCGGDNLRLAELWERFSRLAGVAAPGPAKKKGLLGRLLGGGAADPRSPERLAIDSHSWAYSSEMAAHDWGYEHRPLDQGLEETVAWMRASGLLG
jgi:nucleoside-diphosphate-sugar epimerase